MKAWLLMLNYYSQDKNKNNTFNINMKQIIRQETINDELNIHKLNEMRLNIINEQKYRKKLNEHNYCFNLNYVIRDMKYAM